MWHFSFHHGKMEKEEITGVVKFFRLPTSDSELGGKGGIAERERAKVNCLYF